MLNKISFSEINNKNSRPIVLFGSGNIAKKTIRKLDFNQISFIVDNSLNLQGSKFEKLDIRNP